MTIRKLPIFNTTVLAKLPQERMDIDERATKNWNDTLKPVAAANEKTIDILEPIGEDFFGSGFTAKRMSGALRSIGDADVVVNINSPGGYVDEGATIYNMLAQHKGNVTVRILGMAGSIASIIAMAGDTIEMAKASFFFVHNAHMVAVGNRFIMKQAAEDLRMFDDAMIGVYADRTGLTAREVERLMDGKAQDGTLMNANTAIEKGFADKLLSGEIISQEKSASRRKDVLAIRKLEELVLTGTKASRKDFNGLVGSIKEGMREAVLLSGTRDAADDTTRDAGERAEIDAVLARLSNINIT